MTFEQQMQLWAVVGTWIAGIATIFVAVVALLLARRSEKVRLQANVGLRLAITPGISKEECLKFTVTNVGERQVTIDSIGWRIGKRKNKRFALQIVSTLSPHNYPKKIAHGETAQFLVYFSESPNWMRDFIADFVQDVSDKSINTLRAQIHTSVGHTVDVVPEQSLLEKLKSVGSDGDGN